jgi:uncharacterized protein YbjT (DUF2867 family)
MIWFVNPKTGSDTHDGRGAAAAFSTIQHAMQVAGAGDTLLLAPGIYDQELDKQISGARAAGLIVSVVGGGT